jgi:hypothetical protein
MSVRICSDNILLLALDEAIMDWTLPEIRTTTLIARTIAAMKNIMCVTAVSAPVSFSKVFLSVLSMLLMFFGQLDANRIRVVIYN